MSQDGKFDSERWRRDFPALDTAGGRPLIYLDSAATSLTPQPVIDAVSRFYATCAGTVHRGVHRGDRAIGERYRQARRTVALGVGAEEHEVVFLANTTEALNLVASAHPACSDRPVVVTDANHHSALLPFRRGSLRRVRLQADGTLDLDDLERRLHGAGLLCLPHVSNALGWLMPVDEAVALARRAGALVLLDGAQSVPHMPIDVEQLGVDFLAWSGHKMLAPFGIGVLYGRAEQLALLEPQRWGGGMVEAVTVGERAVDAEMRAIPERFEAGTPNLGGAIGLAAAVDYLEEIGLERVQRHVNALTRRSRRRLREVPGLVVHGPDHDRGACTSATFSFPGMASHALARLLSDRFNIMTRSGFHCAQPLHQTLRWGETVRASFYLYNIEQEVEILAAALTTIGETLELC